MILWGSLQKDLEYSISTYSSKNSTRPSCWARPLARQQNASSLEGYTLPNLSCLHLIHLLRWPDTSFFVSCIQGWSTSSKRVVDSQVTWLKLWNDPESPESLVPASPPLFSFSDSTVGYSTPPVAQNTERKLSLSCSSNSSTERGFWEDSGFTHVVPW